MKNYHSPKLVAKGDVIERTLGIFTGADDPVDGQRLVAPGSMGFNL
jgi:hypothetical protein